MWGFDRSMRTVQTAWTMLLEQPLDVQAGHADCICRDNAGDPVFCRVQLETILTDFPRSPPSDAIGLGNLASFAAARKLG